KCAATRTHVGISPRSAAMYDLVLPVRSCSPAARRGAGVSALVTGDGRRCYSCYAMRRGSWTRSAVALFALALGACGGDDDTNDGAGADAGEPVAWTMIHQEPSAALLAVWAGGDDIWAVGSRTATDAGPLVLHFDGAAWETLDTGLTAVDLWWVYGFEGGPVFLGGSNGTILRYQDGSFENFETPGNGIVFGIWGASASDLWAVGGRFN